MAMGLEMIIDAPGEQETAKPLRAAVRLKPDNASLCPNRHWSGLPCEIL
jgi:hypothetical protein